MKDLKSDVSETQALQQEEPVHTIGSLLKSARLARNLSIESVSKSLNLRMTIVNDIEADDFSNIGSSTYARGYIKNYARLVVADPLLIHECIDSQLGKLCDPAMQSFSRKTTREATDSRLIWLTYLIVFTLLALFILWWIQKAELFGTKADLSQPSIEEVEQLAIQTVPSSIQSQTTTDEIKSNKAILPQDNNPVVSVSGEESHSVLPRGQDEAPREEVNIEDAEITQDNATSQVNDLKLVEANDTVLTEINLTLTGDCWIKIQDATGEVIVSGLKKSGRSITVSGQAPFQAIFGAPRVIQLSLNGKTVNLDKFPSGRVARMTLPLNE
ncbi:DUF4115 domain-containing protein [Parashewanella spongiae]|uniref:DUF4115 domain-containing protein n=1 Tax=Parashewanella spongiae TaxID=342950 RepID=A0A3A6TIJ0_9GAMM|nr:RodZ domain-containing protein [Parashewanella spongiae]MCL1078931.1 DUF4115 domain-containing protein [Parashewanella spongiae]RJY11533.1 DUF4115 domain-containing protein [Parashewanella spongiae]